MAKYSGSGWHKQSIRHSNARKYGKAGGKYALQKKKYLVPPPEGSHEFLGGYNIVKKKQKKYGKSYTYKYQIGRTYTIKNLFYLAYFGSTDKSRAEAEAKKFDYAIVRKDLGQYAVLVPYNPTMTYPVEGFREALQKYKNNNIKLGGILSEKKNYGKTKIEYDFFEDPAHGWLKVPNAELERLGIAGKISGFSYMSGENAYLEEDEDATLFINTKKSLGEDVKLKQHITDNSSPIRRKQGYYNITPELKKQIKDMKEQMLNSRSNWSSKAIRKIKNASERELRYWKEKGEF